MTGETPIDKLCTMIATGALDDELTRVTDALRARERVLDREARTYDNYPVGARVRFNERVRPKYLHGATAVVVSHNRSRGGKYQLEVRLESTRGNFPAGRTTRVMFAIVDLA